MGKMVEQSKPDVVNQTNEDQNLVRLKLGQRLWRNFKKTLTPRGLTIESLKMCVLLALISPPVLMPFYKYFVYAPDKNTKIDKKAFEQIAAHFSGKYEAVEFPSANGKKLRGHYWILPNAKYTIILSHGSGGNADGRILLACALVQCGASVLSYDYQGYGQSEGDASQEILCQDGVSAYDYIEKTRGVKPESIVLYGESIGCAVSLHAMTKRKVAGVIIQNPFTSLVAAARHRLPWFWLYPDSWFSELAGMDNLPLVRGAHPPMLFLNGEKDIALPPRFTDELFAAASEPKTLVKFPNAGHDNVGILDVKEYVDAVGKFLTSLSHG